MEHKLVYIEFPGSLQSWDLPDSGLIVSFGKVSISGALGTNGCVHKIFLQLILSPIDFLFQFYNNNGEQSASSGRNNPG